MRSRLSKSLRPVVATLLLSLVGCGSESDRVLEDTFEQLYTIEPNANINIQNGDGTVLVYGSTVNQMRVRAVKKAYRSERLKKIAVDVFTKPGAIFITTKFPPKPKWGLFDRSGTVDYIIVVPATVSISLLELNAGEILLDGMRGPTTRARLGEGQIFARNSFTNLDLAVRRGNVSMSYDWWEDESAFSAEVNIAQGNAWAFLPSDAAFHLVAKAAHGKIASDFTSMAIVKPSSAAGMNIDTVVNGGSVATIKIRAVEGNIQIVEANE